MLKKKLSTFPIENITMISMTHLLLHISYRMWLAILPILKIELGLTIFMIGVISMIPRIAQSLIYIPSGMIADKIGLRYVIILSLSISGIGSIMLSLSNNFLYILISLCLIALSMTLYHPAGNSYSSELVPAHRAKVMSIHSTGGMIGTALGPILLSFFLLYYNWRTAYFIIAIPILFWIIPINLKIKFKQKEEFKLVNKPSEERDRLKSIFSFSFILFLIQKSLYFMGSESVIIFLTTFLVFTKNISISSSVIIMGIISLVAIFADIIGGFMADRFGYKNWLSISYLFDAILLLFIFFSPSTEALILFLIIRGFVNKLGIAASSSMIVEFTPINLRGRGYAMSFLSITIAGAFGPMIAAVIVEAFSINHIFLYAFILEIISLLILLFIPYSKYSNKNLVSTA